MRKDYVEPDDFEYEPTPHDEVLAQGAGAQEAAAVPASAPEESSAMSASPRKSQSSSHARRAGTGRPSWNRTAKANCSKSPWGRIILRRTASFAWMWCSTASG